MHILSQLNNIHDINYTKPRLFMGVIAVLDHLMLPIIVFYSSISFPDCQWPFHSSLRLTDWSPGQWSRRRSLPWFILSSNLISSLRKQTSLSQANRKTSVRYIHATFSREATSWHFWLWSLKYLIGCLLFGTWLLLPSIMRIQINYHKE